MKIHFLVEIKSIPLDQLSKGTVFLTKNFLLTSIAQDLGSLLTFLKICQPLDEEEFYKRLLLRPLKDGNTAGVELLRVSSHVIYLSLETQSLFKALMSQICLRRTKEVSFYGFSLINTC